MCRSNRVLKKLGGLAVLLQCCVCDAILTSSTPSQSFNTHTSAVTYLPFLAARELEKDSSQQLTWLRLARQQQRFRYATINFWA
jgi:hypothetical protein